MGVLPPLLVRLRRSSLSVKLAALSAVVTAAVVVVTFAALSVETRRNTERAFTDQLERNQRTLHQLQDRSLHQMLVTARLIAKAPTFQYSLKTQQLDANRGAAPSDAYVREIQNQLAQLEADVNADLLAAADDSGRVVASVGPRGAAVPRRTPLGGLRAMRHALDPNVPADSGALAVLRIPDGYLQVAVFPLVQDGFTIGALVMGEPLDSIVARARAASDALVLLTAGRATVAASDSMLRRADVIARLEPRANDPRASTVRLDDEDYVAMALPLGETQDGEPVRLWMLQPLSQRVASIVEPVRRDFILYGAIAVVIAALGAVVAARTVLGPFTRFVRYMRSGAATEERQGPFDANNEAAEVRTLNASFNQLMDSIAVKRRALEQRTAELTAANVVLTDEITERTRVEAALRESEAQLRQSQKLEAIGTLAGGIAHDFNNLITVISGYTQLALMRVESGGLLAEDLRQVMDASDRAANLTHQLLAFSRKQVLQPTVLDLGEVVSGISPMLRRIIGEHIQLEIGTAASLARVRADRGQIEQVLLNLAVNARDAMPSGGSLTIATSNLGDDPPSVALVVRDMGVGMSDDVRDRIFEPFFTTKDVGKGTGLGLDIARRIVVERHGGLIDIESPADEGSDDGKGTLVRVRLPLESRR
jgi:signal transduction histidine kinase